MIAFTLSRLLVVERVAKRAFKVCMNTLIKHAGFVLPFIPTVAIQEEEEGSEEGSEVVVEGEGDSTLDRLLDVSSI